MRQEVLPKNILMIGPTGVGKTEIARRLANLAQAPFLKVEATKFTEIGHVGRDVEQIIRDLVEIAIHMTREKLRKQVAAKAELAAEERVVTALVGEHAGSTRRRSKSRSPTAPACSSPPSTSRASPARRWACSIYRRCSRRRSAVRRRRRSG